MLLGFDELEELTLELLLDELGREFDELKLLLGFEELEEFTLELLL